MNRRWLWITTPVLGLLFLAPLKGLARAGAEARIPVVLDTDIGDDIDDAFALAMLIQSHAVDLKAVTTVSSDTHARARIAAKMLWVTGHRSVPVAAGIPRPGKPFAQAEWAKGFTSPMLVSASAVETLHRIVAAGGGHVVLVAVGPLTNVAALLKQHPEDRRQIKQIVLMGGSIAHGYYPNSGPTAESNIASDVPAAVTVFSSGVPLLVAPLDVTAGLQLEIPERKRIFAQHTALTEALQALYKLWDQPTPTLHDPMAVALLLHPGVSQTRTLQVEITSGGMTREQTGAQPNAEVAVHTDSAAFIRYYVGLFTKP